MKSLSITSLEIQLGWLKTLKNPVNKEQHEFDIKFFKYILNSDDCEQKARDYINTIYRYRCLNKEIADKLGWKID